MFQIDLNERLQLAKQCLNTYNKIQEKKHEQLLEEQKVKKFKTYRKPFDHVQMETKIKVDMMYYEQLFNKLEEQYNEELTNILGKTYSTVTKIYEHVNIEPSIYGQKVNESILTESIDNVSKIINENIWKYIRRNFYDLTFEQREHKYLEQSRQTIKQLVQEGTDVKDAVPFAVKKCVMENLLRNIAFPPSVWPTIKNLSEDVEHYGQVFDVETLNNLVEDFSKKIDALSKVLASVI